jgi:uncharacterized protein YbjT (DUF2867 family)
MRFTTLFTLLPCVTAFVAPGAINRPTFLQSVANNGEDSTLSRRDVFQTAIKGAAAASVLTFLPSAPAQAEEIKTVVVAGATGLTGSRVYERLLSSGIYTATGGVRNVGKASKSLKGTLKQLDVVKDSMDELAEALSGADGLIIATGMNPGKNLLRMSAAAHEVDNLGTIKLIDAAKKAGVKKVVMVSSILTNGRAWGQEESPGFVITNAFGGALDEKLQAEKYLRASGLDYTIVRPGGLQSEAPTGALSINAEDTLNSGEISRDLVADVCVASLSDAKASKKVLEIYEDTGSPPKVFNGLNM